MYSEIFSGRSPKISPLALRSPPPPLSLDVIALFFTSRPLTQKVELVFALLGLRRRSPYNQVNELLAIALSWPCLPSLSCLANIARLINFR